LGHDRAVVRPHAVHHAFGTHVLGENVGAGRVYGTLIHPRDDRSTVSVGYGLRSLLTAVGIRQRDIVAQQGAAIERPTWTQVSRHRHALGKDIDVRGASVLPNDDDSAGTVRGDHGEA